MVLYKKTGKGETDNLNNKKEIKKGLADLKKANITVRNFPATVAELRKRTKLMEGGNTYLFASTLNDEQKVLVLCEKV